MVTLTSSADVPSVRLQQDPGVQAEPGAFQSPLGIAAEEFKPAVDEFKAQAIEKEQRLAKAQTRINIRKNSLSRLTAQTKYRDGRRKSLDGLMSTADMTEDGVLESYGKEGRDQIDELVKQHKGDEESKIRLAELLEKDFADFADEASGEAVGISDARVEQKSGEVLSGFEARALAGEDPSSLISEGLQWMEPGTELADSMRTGDEVAFGRNLRQRIMSGSIERLFMSRDTESIRDALWNPIYQRNLGENKLNAFFGRLAKIENTPEKDEKMVEVFDENSPTKSKFVRESESEGMFGRVRSPLVSMGGQTAFAKELDKGDAKYVKEVESMATIAFRTKAEVQRMQAAIESGRFTTGVFHGARVFLARLADFAEADEETKAMLGDAATADTMDSAASRLAVDAATKLGRITNMSLQFIKESLPSLARTPDGNKILMEVMNRTADREIQIANMMESYLNMENPTLRPSGKRSFYQAVRDLEEDDPVITEELKQRIINGAKSSGTRSFKELFDGVGAEEMPTYSSQDEVDTAPPGTKFKWAGNPDKTYQKPKLPDDGNE